MHRTLIAAVATVLTLLSCGGDDGPTSFTRSDDDLEGHQGVYVAEVLPAPDGSDVADGAGEYVVLRSTLDIRDDVGFWGIEVGDEVLRLPPSTVIPKGGELRVYSGPGRDSETEIHGGRTEELLPDETGTVRVLDAGGGEADRFRYGAD